MSRSIIFSRYSNRFSGTIESIQIYGDDNKSIHISAIQEDWHTLIRMMDIHEVHIYSGGTGGYDKNEAIELSAALINSINEGHKRGRKYSITITVSDTESAIYSVSQ